MDFEKLTELIIELEVDDIADAVKEALDEGNDSWDTGERCAGWVRGARLNI